MLTKGISFKNFKAKKSKLTLKKQLLSILKSKNPVLDSLKKNYKNNYKSNFLDKYKKVSDFRLIGMGGSTLGTQTVYDFLREKIKKNFEFVDNLQSVPDKQSKKNYTNLIISKSGNTIETIINAKIYIKKKDKNIIITENKNNQLYRLAEKLKAEIIHHNNFIGGRYSVLSEVGMLPAELMGFNPNKFRQLNLLIKNKNFLNILISNVASILHLINKKKFNSVIINYDEKSESLFKWYQQLVAESLGKKGKGLLPIVSNMPKDNHSVMQLYLDGFQNNFFTFFFVNEIKSKKMINKNFLFSQNYLKNKKLLKILHAKKEATENVFNKKKIPFRSIEIAKRDEKTLGELFCFFILETILLGKSLNVNPYDQPAVELIKDETKKILI